MSANTPTTFEELYTEHVDDTEGVALLKALHEKNNKLLRNTGKDLDLLQGVYGDTI